MIADLIQGPAGVSCARCGAVLPSGATLDGHATACPVAAAERARIVLGGSSSALARALYREAYAAGGAACVEAVAGALREMAAALDAPSVAGRGPWQQTFTGQRFYPLAPLAADVHVADIAHHLALVCRFGGAVRTHYSVAQHSCHVADYVEERGAATVVVLAALMHDATEAYVGDMVRPLKGAMPAFRDAEGRVWRAIAERFGLPAELPAIVHEADDALLCVEARDLMGGECAEKWAGRGEGVSGVVAPWGWERAEREFLERAADLMGRVLLAGARHEEGFRGVVRAAGVGL